VHGHSQARKELWRWQWSPTGMEAPALPQPDWLFAGREHGSRHAAGFLRESVASNGQVPFVPEQVHELERKIVSGWLAAVHSDLEHNPFTEAELATLEKEEGAEGRAAVESSPELAYGATLAGGRGHRKYCSICSSAMARS
jgi:hypothetical protein